jgi:cytidyltransferase-like protein
MYISELFHGGPEQPKEKQAELVETSQTQLVVLYPGRFQPFHLGHADVFRTLQAKFGRDNVFIATSNKTDAKKSPFNFTDKTTIMHAAGVPNDRILEVQSPYKLPAQFDPTKTVFVVAVGAPDADRLQPDAVKKDGNPGYYKTFKSLDQCVTADQHGYVVIAAERQKVITLNGQQVDVSHGTPSRAAWNSVRKDPKGRAEYMNQMFGRADQELGLVLDKIPESVGESLEEGAPIVVMPMAGHFPGQKKPEPIAYAPSGMGSYRRGVEDAKAGKPYNNPYPFEKSLGAAGNYDHNSYREGYQSASKTTESIEMPRKQPIKTQPIHPEELDRLITSVGQKAKQGPMKTVWNPVTRKYKVVPAAQASLEEDDVAPMTREEYNYRRKVLQQIQMDPELTRDPILRKELIKKIAQLTMQARAAGVLPESVYAAHVQENKLFEAKAIVNTIKHLKESMLQEGIKTKIAAGALAGAMATGAGAYMPASAYTQQHGKPLPTMKADKSRAVDAEVDAEQRKNYHKQTKVTSKK